jgi:hypothetical protein
MGLLDFNWKISKRKKVKAKTIDWSSVSKLELVGLIDVYLSESVKYSQQAQKALKAKDREGFDVAIHYLKKAVSRLEEPSEFLDWQR